MINTFHEHQLPVRPLGVGLVLERSAQFLDGYISIQDSVVAGAAREGNAEGLEVNREGAMSWHPKHHWYFLFNFDI